jgi:hypothetical protein
MGKLLKKEAAQWAASGCCDLQDFSYFSVTLSSYK